MPISHKRKEEAHFFHRVTANASLQSEYMSGADYSPHFPLQARPDAPYHACSMPICIPDLAACAWNPGETRGPGEMLSVFEMEVD